MTFQLRFDDKEVQKERSRKALEQHPGARRVREQLPEIHRLLRETMLSSREISGVTGVSPTTIGRIAKELGIDLHVRNAVKRGRPKPTSASELVRTVMHETMTQDGVSLKWLSRKWTLNCTDVSADAGSI